MALLSLGLAWCAGCAHAEGGGGNETGTGARVLPWQGGPAPASVEPPARPVGHSAARDMIEEAFAASAAQDTWRALDLFRAVLSSDTLTDKGRANLYWVVAGLYRSVGDGPAESDALAAFLVASELVDADERILAQQLVARALRAALRVESEPHFGRTPEAPIRVEDTREPASILASLPCGRSGEGRYLDVGIDGYTPLEGERLIRRRAACDESGDVLDLWFDVTYARHAERP